MAALNAAGRRITGVMDPAQGRQWLSAAKRLHDAGIDLNFPDPHSIPGLNILHHKLLVIGDAIVVAGSMNYTAPANDYNDSMKF